MSLIKSIQAREILDSRGIPTVEALLTADDGSQAVASIPSGTSTGSHEAKELRDANPQNYQGLGVLKAVENVNKILGPAIIGRDPTRQTEIDQILIDLDGTPDKSHLGSNAILAVSQGICELGAVVTGYPTYKYLHLKYRLSEKLDMPTPIFNVINGGKHGTEQSGFSGVPCDSGYK